MHDACHSVTAFAAVFSSFQGFQADSSLKHIRARQADRNENNATADWHFLTGDARIKL